MFSSRGSLLRRVLTNSYFNVGKSTLMLQVAGAVASLAVPQVGIGMGPSIDSGSSGPVWYISGEENAQQIASRAMRLGIHESELWLLSETHVDTLCEQVVSSYHPNEQMSAGDAIPGQKAKPPSLIIIDSIQTMTNLKRNPFKIKNASRRFQNRTKNKLSA